MLTATPSSSSKNSVSSSFTKVAVFASGAGSNAQNLIRYFKNHSSIQISLVVCNKQGAGVLEVAKAAGVPVLLVKREQFLTGDAYLPDLMAAGITFIVLAGFLWKIPATLVAAYPKRIVNLHPALLPSYGGKGMYGANVHQAVITNGEKESGITIHYVDEHYDNGDILFQASCPVTLADTPQTLAAKIHELEYRHLPTLVEGAIASL